MKKIILIVFSVILAVIIGTTLFIGSGEDSFKSQSETIVKKAGSAIDNIKP